MAHRVLSSQGIAGWRSTFDERGRELTRAFLDASGGAGSLKNERYSSWRARYNDRGQQIEIWYFAADGTPALVRGGYATERTVRDDRGNKVEATFFDEKGELSRSLWAARAHYDYDKYGRESERRFFDADGKLLMHPDSGRAIVRFERDAAGRVLKELSLDLNGRPINRKDDGWFERVYQYRGEWTAAEGHLPADKWFIRRALRRSALRALRLPFRCPRRSATTTQSRRMLCLWTSSVTHDCPWNSSMRLSAR